MKTNKFTEFFKGKGYYVLLFVGVLAIAAVAIIGSNLSSEPQDKGRDYVDLNEPDSNNIVTEDKDYLDADWVKIPNPPLTEGNNSVDNKKPDPIDNDSLLEYDVFTEDEEAGMDLVEDDETAEVAENPSVDSKEAIETGGKTVQAENTPLQENLNFQEDKGLMWPVSGNVIMNYSMDRTIYHATLMQFKCNPAIIIDAEVGTEVRAAADGKITSIEENEVTGFTVTTDIGNGYSLVYGQLEKNDSLKVGSIIREGKVISKVKEPTKYYSVEGSNLYFMVMQNEETVNPMLYLR